MILVLKKEYQMAFTTAENRWSKVIDLQEKSGLTTREFARAHQINPNTLSWWRWALGRTRTTKNRSAFVEVKISEPRPSFSDERAAVTGAAGLEISLNHLEATLRVSPATDLQLLRNVLEVLC